MHDHLDFTVVILILSLVFADCAIVQPPNAEGRSAIRAGKQTIVLFSITSEIAEGIQANFRYQYSRR